MARLLFAIVVVATAVALALVLKLADFVLDSAELLLNLSSIY